MGDWPLLAALGTEELAERDDDETSSAPGVASNPAAHRRQNSDSHTELH
jgi:hypothetical protein